MTTGEKANFFLQVAAAKKHLIESLKIYDDSDDTNPYIDASEIFCRVMKAIEEWEDAV